MFRKRETISARPPNGSDVRCALLLAAIRAFRQAEIEAVRDPSRAGRVMAEYAELVVLPGSSRT